MGLLRTLSFIHSHPLNRASPAAGIARFMRLQMATRIQRAKMIVPWINGTRVILGAGDTGLTGNYYCGLLELEDMAFVLHYLRDSDLFVDVGANAGAYTILAAGVVHCRTIALEPVPSVFARFLDNVRINALEGRVDCLNEGAGASAGQLDFSSDKDTVNHVVAPEEVVANPVRVRVRPLDAIVPRAQPVVLKIDVEGFETRVIEGARQLLESGCVETMIIELNRSGARYGFEDGAIVDELRRSGLYPVRYDPFKRELAEIDRVQPKSGNTLFVRSIEQARTRVQSAPTYCINGTSI